MPGVARPGEMNGFDRGAPLTRYNELGPNGYEIYREESLVRDEMKNDREDPYRRGGMPGRNGGPVMDGYGDANISEAKFELDHLATFAAGSRDAFIAPEEGLKKLSQMENTTGIWTMKCVLSLERSALVLHETNTGEELERFPLNHVQDPTAIFKNDRREIYNNLILFTIVEDPKRRPTQADMHIFQSARSPAQEIVDEILAAKAGYQRYNAGGGTRPPPPEQPNGAYNFHDMREFVDQSRQYGTSTYGQATRFGGPAGQQQSLITRVNTLREREDLEGGSNEVLERDVALLNHCFDDIEKFVARLQQAAESFKELERRKRDRGAKNKKRQGGDGMLTARAKPPPDRDFVDIFQKFKLSFNLLAKLKAHIHDPNAPELVHFLFTPLSLIYEASRDPSHGNQNLGDQAVAPVLTSESKQLLLNCLTTKEIELWQALGKYWLTSREEWKGHIPPYMPEFYDGWLPAASVVDELATRPAMMSQQPPLIMPSEQPRNPGIDNRSLIYNQPPRPLPFPDDDRPPLSDRFGPPLVSHNDPDRFDVAPTFERTLSRDFIDTAPAPWGYDPRARDVPQLFAPSQEPQFPQRFPKDNGRHALGQLSAVQPPPHSHPKTRQDENTEFLNDLLKQNAIAYEAIHDRTGKNQKELSVEKGDILQVLDNDRNWWKLRNFRGQVGFAPYTILTQYKPDGNN